MSITLVDLAFAFTPVGASSAKMLTVASPDLLASNVDVALTVSVDKVSLADTWR